jgi:arylsulfatase
LLLSSLFALPAYSEQPPNVLLLLADDLGFADLRAFGGEIDTPGLEDIARAGTIYTHFYTSPLCAPSRAMLLTGRDAHEVGLGNQPAVIAANQRGREGYEGFLNARALTIATIFSQAGYFTAMAGKWHLGYSDEGGPAAKGFQRFFALGNGGASHYADMGGPHLLEPEATYMTHEGPVDALEGDFYSSDSYTSRLLSYLEENRPSGKPFFAYLAFTAPHWPLHARAEDRERYVGRYDDGYEALRSRRYERQKKLGLVDPDQELPPWPASVPRWKNLPAGEQRREARLMEVYAGMVSRMDWNIGRVLAYLEGTGQLANTLVVFASDNGPAGSVREARLPVFEKYMLQFDNSYENLGLKGSYALYHQGWAVAGSTPFRGYKGYPYEGGIRAPAIVRYPERFSIAKGRSNRIVSLADLHATMLHAALGNRETVSCASSIRGRSLLLAESASSKGKSVFTEVNGNVALVSGSMKLVRTNLRIGTGSWQLYDLARDPVEQNDLAREDSLALQAMLAKWTELAQALDIVMPEGTPELLKR